MSVFSTSDVSELEEFPKSQDRLAILERKVLEGSDIFFPKVMTKPFGVVGLYNKENGEDDIREILEDVMPDFLKEDLFYDLWVSDMVEVCDIFCNILSSESIGFSLSTERGCRRYHIDNVPMRLLVTYAGKGTEWLPDDAADREALANGAPNEEIIIDPSKRQFMDQWDIAIFRGGAKGLLHRTPDAALNEPSILMRLDHASFWDNILKQQSGNKFLLAVKT